MIQTIIQIYTLIQTNADVILGALFGLWAFAEAVVRFTPTKKDDAALEYVGRFMKRVLDLLGVPNRRKIEVEIKGEKKPEENTDESKSA